MLYTWNIEFKRVDNIYNIQVERSEKPHDNLVASIIINHLRNNESETLLSSSVRGASFSDQLIEYKVESVETTKVSL
ncbi:hypothetical protein [Neptunomonas japonica]|uniref:hypothetical protein n=1 Tax=Neptunomonas japonica TaxID=417574 RepID=UPI00041B793C|nr:hypothetical protein [Neptunomonas japonica]